MRSPHIDSTASRTPSLQRTKSDPCFTSNSGRVVPLSLNNFHPHPQAQALHNSTLLPMANGRGHKMGKRVMTVPTNLTQYHNPTIVLELLLNLPMECHMGIGEGLKPLIAKAIAEQQEMEANDRHHLATIAACDAYDRDHLPPPPPPLAIPPTAPAMLERVRERVDSLDDELLLIDKRKPASTGAVAVAASAAAALSRKASVKQFESVLQERYTLHLMLAVSQALFGAFLSGYNTSVLNTPSAIIQARCMLNIDQYASLQSFFCLGGLVGALSIGKVADTYGRKLAILVYDFVFFVSGATVAYYAVCVDKSAPNSWICFAVARCLSGVGAGIATAIIPTYLGEISPPLIRGAIGTLNQLTVCVGLLAAELCGGVAIFLDAALWPWLFALNLALPLLQCATFWSFPESPKWLITQHREDEARKVLQRLRECDDVEVDLDFTKMANRYQAQQRKRTHTLSRLDAAAHHTVHTVSERDHLLAEQPAQQKQQHAQYGAAASAAAVVEIKDNVHKYSLGVTDDDDEQQHAAHDLRRILAWSMGIAIGLQFLQQLSGINSVFYYSNPTLMTAGFVSDFHL